MRDPGFRGQGIGTRLVEAYLALCARAGLPGVHVVTAPGSRNVAFYHRCGLDFALRRSWQGRQLLFLGVCLGPDKAPGHPAATRENP